VSILKMCFIVYSDDRNKSEQFARYMALRQLNDLDWAVVSHEHGRCERN